MANYDKTQIGYNENTTANAQMVQLGRRYAAPLDISEVFTSLDLAKAYAMSDPISYAGQKISVAGENLRTEVYKIMSGGTLVRLVDEEDLAAFELPDNLATIEDVASASANTFNEVSGYIEIKLEDYATKSYVSDVLADLEGGNITLDGYAKEENVKASANTLFSSAKTYTDGKFEEIESELMWLPVDGEAANQKVRSWRGSRENYEFLVSNSATSPYTRYVVIDNINGQSVITEYYGTNQVSDATGQLLPVKSIITAISDIEPQPYDRYLVGRDGAGYNVYEYVISSDGSHRWLIKTFDYRYGIRVIDRGLKNFVYIDGMIKTYDDVDCGEF